MVTSTHYLTVTSTYYLSYLHIGASPDCLFWQFVGTLGISPISHHLEIAWTRIALTLLDQTQCKTKPSTTSACPMLTLSEDRHSNEINRITKYSKVSPKSHALLKQFKYKYAQTHLIVKPPCRTSSLLWSNPSVVPSNKQARQTSSLPLFDPSVVSCNKQACTLGASSLPQPYRAMLCIK